MTLFRIYPLLLGLTTAILLSGCATQPPPLAKSDTELPAPPTSAHNVGERSDAIRQRDLKILRWQGLGDTARAAGDLDTAESAYRKSLAIEPTNLRATWGLEQVAAERRHRTIVATAARQMEQGDITGAQETLRPVLIENPKQRDARDLHRRIDEQRLKNRFQPVLNSSIRKPITLEFRDANLRSVFEVISKVSGINFIFDKDVRSDLKATIFIKNGHIEDAIRMLLVTNQLEQKILGDNSILIYPNIPAKTRDYQDLMVKSFYLGNADVKQTLNLLKTILKTKDVYFDEKLNMLVIRDTPQAVAMAERLISAQDLAEPEVMLEMEVLEVSTSRLSELGIRYPDQIGFGVVGAASQTAGVLSLSELHNLKSDMVRVTMPDPAILLKLSNTDTDSNLLANPRIRVKNREKARIHIGERVPVITTTSTANVGISESVNYLEVGLKLNVEPNVYLDDDVAIKVGLEVSNIIDTITTTTGSKTYRLGTRTAETLLRLKDGETQVLAGLIQDMDRKSAQKVPLLAQIPLLGRLFSSDEKNKSKTEIMLLITPHIVRNLDRPAADVTEFMSGTESNIGGTYLSMDATPDLSGNNSTNTNSSPSTTETGNNASSAERSRNEGQTSQQPQFSLQPYVAPTLPQLPASPDQPQSEQLPDEQQ